MRFPLLDRLLGRTDGRVPAIPAGRVRPVIDRDFPDPDVLVHGDRFYAYSTNSVYQGRLLNVPVHRAGSLTGRWSMLGDAMPERAPWVASPEQGGSHVWAPEVTAVPGGHLIYYTAHHATHRVQCLGVAAAQRPEGPFRPVGAGPLVCRPEDGDTLDAESFVDADGTRYLIYKSGRRFSTMWLQRMSADGLQPLGERTELIRSDRRAEANIVEAPSMVRRNGRYVLFFSANTFNSGHYFVNYAVAPRLDGPYVKARGTLLSTDSIGRAYPNTGHEGVVRGSDGDYLVFHASTGPTERAMFVIGLGWDADGRPVIQPERPGAVC